MPKDKKELVKSMDAGIVIPLALFAALKEVEATPCCPVLFDSTTLRQYNGRYAMIEKARQALAALDTEEKKGRLSEKYSMNHSKSLQKAKIE